MVRKRVVGDRTAAVGRRGLRIHQGPYAAGVRCQTYQTRRFNAFNDVRQRVPIGRRETAVRGYRHEWENAGHVALPSTFADDTRDASGA